MRQVVIIGAGGHAAVVADALLCAGENVVGFTDRDGSRHGTMLCGLPILGDDSVLPGLRSEHMVLANGIGGVRGEALRREVQATLEGRGWRFTGVRHPSAVVSRFADLGEGVQLMAGCVVQPGARLGNGSIVNTSAVIEHDAHLGAYVHVAPRAVLCGCVEIGSGSHVGAGAVVKQGIRLGDMTIVGAGAVVVKDSHGGEVLAGNPARPQDRQK